MWIAVLITLAVPGIAYALWRRKGRDAARLAWDGVVSGSIPMAVSAVWAVAFMRRKPASFT